MNPTNAIRLVLISLAFVFVCALPVSAEHLPIKIYTSADGLGSSFVNYLMRDSRGFLWFCTRDGLSRFDGSRFVTYQIGDKLGSPGIEFIYETREGVYWITTISGLYRFDPADAPQANTNEGGRFVLHARFISNRRGVLHQDRAGNLWFGNDGLYLLKDKRGEVTFQKIALDLPARVSDGFTVTELSETADGSLWINTNWGVLRRLPDTRFVFHTFESSLDEGNLALLTDAGGRIWLARAADLYVFKPAPPESFAGSRALTVKPFAPNAVVAVNAGEELRLPESHGAIFQFTNPEFITNKPVKKLFETSDAHVWLTTETELIEFDGRTFRRYTNAQGLQPGMRRMVEDAAGNLWIGGQTSLMRLDRKGLITYGVADNLNSARLHAINEDPDGALYFANGDFYLSRFDGKGFQTVRPQLSPDARTLWASRNTYLSRAGEWWILTHDKLYRFAHIDDFAKLNLAIPRATYDARDNLKPGGMFQIFEDARGDIWVSVRGTAGDAAHGLARLRRGEEKFYTFAESDGFPVGKSASAFAEDAEGNLWIGFYEGGIVRFRDNRFEQFTERDGVPADLITDLHLDRVGRLWLSSSTSGLSRIDAPNDARPRFASYTTGQGLVSNNIRTITEDAFGNIYVGSARGVDRISPDAARVKHYSVNDGLAADFVVDSHCDRTGALWFATTNGLSRLVPLSDAEMPPQSPPVRLGGLRVAGVAQSVSTLGDNVIDKLDFAHTQNNLQLDFFGLDFRPGETLRYQFMLEGADASWSLPTEGRTITYANLRPGAYRFLVRAVTSEGTPSRTPAAVSFTIRRPVWQQWWFLMLAAVALTLVIHAVYRSRLRRLIEMERVRTRIATDLHDDIGASMSQIAILSEVANKRAGDADSALNELLTTIAATSGEMVDSMSDIVWAINPQRDHLSDLTQRMRRFASDTLNARDIEFRFRHLDTNKDFRIGTNVRREVYLMFKETINNLVKHSRCATAEIEFRVEDEWLMVEVSDDGNGFDVAATLNGTNGTGMGGHGLASMRRRAAELSGTYEIESGKGQGTRVTTKVPLMGGGAGRLRDMLRRTPAI